MKNAARGVGEGGLVAVDASEAMDHFVPRSGAEDEDLDEDGGEVRVTKGLYPRGGGLKTQRGGKWTSGWM